MRADAARNRAKLLEAAQTLVREQGAENVTMEAVAAAACVGKGTVFRRFGDRAGLMYALLDQGERDFQQAFIFGPPPLGPGAPPVERLEAFGAALLRHLERHLDVFVAASREPVKRLGVGPARVHATHIAMLLQQAKVGGDVEQLTQVLLGFFEPSQVKYLLTERGRSVEDLERGWRDLVRRITHRC
ncbi:TetR/AcrR family transcriptional regulator [Streptacidiphilus monticola]